MESVRNDKERKPLSTICVIPIEGGGAPTLEQGAEHLSAQATLTGGDRFPTACQPVGCSGSAIKSLGHNSIRLRSGLEPDKPEERRTQ
jgi:hypothetical protein